MVASIIPQFVPAFYSSMYTTALYGGLIVAFIGLMGIAMEKRDIQVLILTDIVGLAMLIVVAAVGTDLSEALILPGLVVELAEIMAISEILISREMRKKDVDTSFAPMPLNIDMVWCFPIRFYWWCSSWWRYCNLCFKQKGKRIANSCS